MAFNLIDFEKVISELRRRLRLLEIRGGGIIKTGLAADIPTTPNISEGSTTSYYATDTKTLYIWNAQTSSWNLEIFT